MNGLTLGTSSTIRVVCFDDFGGTELIASVTGRVEWKNKPIKHRIVLIAQKAIRMGMKVSREGRLCAMNGMRARYFLSTVVNMGGSLKLTN